MDKKLMWIDCETTGVHANEHAIIQLAYIVEINGDVKEEGNLLIQPFNEGGVIDKIASKALEVNGRTREEIFLDPFLKPREAYQKFVTMMAQYVYKFDKSDKLYTGGYNVSFDMNFLSEFFFKNGDKYFGSWFNGRKLDPLYKLSEMDYDNGISLPNYKLKTVCDYFEIKIEAHDALSDIRATRELWNKLNQ